MQTVLGFRLPAVFSLDWTNSLARKLPPTLLCSILPAIAAVLEATTASPASAGSAIARKVDWHQEPRAGSESILKGLWVCAILAPITPQPLVYVSSNRTALRPLHHWEMPGWDFSADLFCNKHRFSATIFCYPSGKELGGQVIVTMIEKRCHTPQPETSHIQVIQKLGDSQLIRNLWPLRSKLCFVQG